MFKIQKFYYYNTSVRCYIKNTFEYHKTLKFLFILKIKHCIFDFFFASKLFDYKILQNSNCICHNNLIKFNLQNFATKICETQIVETNRIFEKYTIDNENLL